MSYSIKLFLALLMCLRQETELAVSKRKFVYQRDMSEYCRRRAVPSVFVGRHVVEATSQILHFSRMELPYSCFISVRTESGNDLILVIQLLSDESLIRSCSESGNQLLVYEMGETFGGYWGPLPDTVMKPEPVGRTKFYTLKTTESTTDLSATEEENDSVEETMDSSSVSNQTPTNEADDYIRIEVPIVNVSGKLVPGEVAPESAFDVDEAFDFIYDVTPWPGSKYETSILPLVQFSIRKQTDGRREDGSPLYQLDVMDTFTPDLRLTLPQLSHSTFKKKNINRKNKFNANRRHNYKKSRPLFNANASSYLKKFSTNPWLHLHTNTRPIIRNTMHINQNLPTKGTKLSLNNMYRQYTRASWKLIDDLMKKLNKRVQLNSTEEKAASENKSTPIQSNNITKNNSAHLTTNLPFYNEFTHKNHLVTITKKYAFIASTRKLVAISDRKNSYKVTEPTYNASASFKVTQNNISSHTNQLETESVTAPLATNRTEYPYVYNTSPENNIVENITTGKQPEDSDTQIYNKTTKYSKEELYHTFETENPLRGSMVDHESWENVVQAAPVMAVLLNKTVVNIKENVSDGDFREINGSNHRSKSFKRKKRYIHSISIKNAQPYSLSTSRDTGTTQKVTYRIADMQEFAQLVELQDDEMHGRVALRYLRQYVGPALFNICETRGSSERHIFLFNSSRIVLAISNFTYLMQMDRISVVLTPARTLLSADARCGTTYLECQVSGARVCVDSLTACDGVPNCGSYDIYDEDRLMCGAAVGLQHNVCLAAFAFMAVLLTVLYTVHYWLKRCVPKVAEAFFIYTDGVENILYLDSVMRSPTDMDDDMKMRYHGDLFDEYNIYGGSQMKPGKRNIRALLKKFFLFNIFRRKSKMKATQEEMIGLEFSPICMEPKKMYSFTELQISKMIDKELVDTSVQTGDSLEMTNLEKVKRKEKIIKSNNMENEFKSPMAPIDSLLTLVEPLPEHKHVEELSLLKFLKDAKSDSIRSIRSIDKSIKTRKKEDIKRDIATDEEMEIKTHDYDHRSHTKPSKSTGITITTECDVHSVKPEPSGYIRKRLRFEEETTTIPLTDYDQETVLEGNENLSHRRSMVLGAGKKWGIQNLDTIEESVEHSSSRDHRRFWTSNKGKKSKKKG